MFHRAHLARPCRPQESPTITAGRRALIWSACHFVCVPAIMGVHGTIASEPWIFIQGIASRERAHDADVSEFRYRILMQRPASPFVTSNAVRGTWAGRRYPPSGGPDRLIGAADSCTGRSGGRTQIVNHSDQWPTPSSPSL